MPSHVSHCRTGLRTCVPVYQRRRQRIFACTDLCPAKIFYFTTKASKYASRDTPSNCLYAYACKLPYTLSTIVQVAATAAVYVCACLCIGKLHPVFRIRSTHAHDRHFTSNHNSRMHMRSRRLVGPCSSTLLAAAPTVVTPQKTFTLAVYVYDWEQRRIKIRQALHVTQARHAQVYVFFFWHQDQGRNAMWICSL